MTRIEFVGLGAMGESRRDISGPFARLEAQRKGKH